MSHIHKTHNRLLRYFGLTVIVAFGVISTLGTGGGGGGGGDGDDGVEPVIYTGLTTQAQITATNAKTLGEVAFLGATVGTSFSVASVQSAPQDETRSASVVNIVRALHSVVNKIDVSSALGSSIGRWLETLSDPGNCGGSLSGSLDVDEVEETFTGSLVFDDYCETPTADPADGFTIDGVVGFDGTCDPATFNATTQTCDIIDFTMRLTNVNGRGYGESQTMSGDLTSAITVTGYETTVNLRLRDDGTDVTFKFESYVITVTENSPTFGTDTIEVSGDAYHPDHGYVVLSTITPVQLPSGSMGPPESGDLLLTGADGTVGPTTATFTFTGFNTYTVTIDTDGDGVTNVTLSCTWDPDNCVIV